MAKKLQALITENPFSASIQLKAFKEVSAQIQAALGTADSVPDLLEAEGHRLIEMGQLLRAAMMDDEEPAESSDDKKKKKKGDEEPTPPPPDENK